MCSYKVIKVFFEVWGFQTRVEAGVHRVSFINMEYNIMTTPYINYINIDFLTYTS
jgi:hypothetical protein